MKQNTLLIIGGVIVAYYLWKKSQEETTSDFSNISGKKPKGKRPCYCQGVSIGYYSAHKCEKICSEATLVELIPRQNL